jgi:hypothetical protein
LAPKADATEANAPKVAPFLNLEKNPSFSLSFPSVLFVFEFSSSLLVDSGSFGYQNSHLNS